MSKLSKLLTKDILIEQYKTKSTRKIAEEFNCSASQVLRYMRNYNIKRRPGSGYQANAGRPLGAKDSYKRQRNEM